MMEFVNEIVQEHMISKKSQKMSFIDSAIRRILLSKHLLTDHIEILEHCGAIPTKYIYSSGNIYYKCALKGALAFSAVGLTSINTNINCLKYLFSTAAAAFSFYILVDLTSIVSQKLTELRLNETILNIKNVDVAIRKNTSLFRDYKCLGFESNLENGEKNMEKITRIIQIIYDEVKQLELISIPIHIENLYEAVGELSECLFFQNGTETIRIDHINTFYNIFLFLQSQYLLRLCLVLVYNYDIGQKYLNSENIQFRDKLKEHTNDLRSCTDEIIHRIKSKSKLTTLKIINETNIKSTDVEKVKINSTDILCHLIAITSKFQDVDQRIQLIETSNPLWKEKILSISVEITQAKELLSTCKDKFEIFETIHKRCLSQDDETSIKQGKGELYTYLPNSSKSVDESSEMMAQDENREYFGLRSSFENEDEIVDIKNSSGNWEDTFNSNDMNLTRLSFAPVLRQLKSRIDPIKAEMKERELKFLMSKGIDREKIIEFDQNDDSQSDMFAQNFGKTDLHDRYSETRSFLQQKQPFFLALASLPPPLNSEEIIE